MPMFKNLVKNFLFLIIFILSGLTLVIVIEGVRAGSELTPFNTGIENLVRPLRTVPLTHIMVAVTNVGSPLVLTVISLFLAIALILHRETYDTLLYISSMLLAIISLTVLKNTFQFARPIETLVSIGGWSFPSGHATISTAFFFVTGYSFFDWVKSASGKIILVLGCAAAAALICFSRVYLGVHFALDVLAGIALGLISVSFTALIFNLFLREKEWRLTRKKL